MALQLIAISPGPFHGIALAHLIGWRPWHSSSLPSHQGHSMALLWHISLGGGHGTPAHCHLTRAIPWHCFGTSHWVEAMALQLIAISPGPFHGIALAHLIGWRPWHSSSLPSHQGHSMALLWHISLVGGHG